MAKATSTTPTRGRAKPAGTVTKSKTQQQAAGDTTPQGASPAEAPKAKPQQQSPGDNSTQGAVPKARGGQRQSKAKPQDKGTAGESSQQGANSSGEGGGQKQMLGGVEIEVVPIPARGGSNKPEIYPFSKLPLATAREGGGFEGPSFFIPESDNPEKHLANARKVVPRNEGLPEFLFHARADTKDGVDGKRVWKTKAGVKIR